MPKVSVIIPCYNHGGYLDEAVDSVLAQSYDDLEIIIVNDGSTDELTKRICSGYDREKTRVISTANQGLAAARNTGIAAAAGQYILPLDADDRIGGNYIAEAVEILDNDESIGIVYCRARLFGAVETDWHLPDYSLAEMLKDNIIFCSALFRRSDWQEVGGYDPGMIYGWEDYDFWLCLLERGRGVRQLPERNFHYRVAPDSMVRTKEKWQKVAMFKRIFQRHAAFIGEHIEIWLKELLETRERYYTARLYVDCGRRLSDEDSVPRKIEPGTKEISFSLDTFTGVRALRFDPVDCPAILKIQAIEFIAEDGSRFCDLTGIGSNCLFRQENLFMFDTADPQIFLPLPGISPQGLQKLMVTIDYLSFEAQALREIIAHQKQQLARYEAPLWSRWLNFLKKA